MDRFIQVIERLTKHWMTEFILGLILVVTGSAEVLANLMEEAGEVSLGAHHGVIAYGLFRMFGSIPDIFEGLKKTTCCHSHDTGLTRTSSPD